MEFLRKLLKMTKTKPYKIQDAERKVGRVGITAASLKDLKKKAAMKLKIETDFKVVLEKDGTEVEDEDYFASLPEQTALVCLKPGEFWDGYITYLQLATKKIVDNLSSGKETVEKVQSMFKDAGSPEMAAILNYIKDISVNIEAETIEEDPCWFDGVAKKFATKEQLMKQSAKQRVRGYLNSGKEFINKSDIDKSTRETSLKLFNNFREELKRRKYFEDYFARSAVVEVRICDKTGRFACEGPYDKVKCEKLHSINPYGSKDHRVLFKTWNLDHRIEKSREILPKLVEAVRNCPRIKEVNWEYFFNLLFTRDNLKIVDVRCHDLSAHNNCVVDQRHVYRKKKH